MFDPGTQATRATEKVIEQLNLQLEISQESQREAEDHAARLLLEIDELKQRNEKLKIEMNDIGQMATVLEQERIQAVERAERAHNDINVAKLTTKNRELEDQLEETLRSRYAVELKLTELQDTYNKIKDAEPVDITKLKKERDFYQNAYRTMSEREHGTDEHITTTQVTRLIQEKDEKSKKLIDNENKLNETLGNLRVVQQERDRLQLQVEQLNDELTQIRREMVEKGSSMVRQSPTKSTPQSIIKRVEMERDQAMTELRRVTCERDSLLEQVKANIYLFPFRGIMRFLNLLRVRFYWPLGMGGAVTTLPDFFFHTTPMGIENLFSERKNSTASAGSSRPAYTSVILQPFKDLKFHTGHKFCGAK